LLTSPRRFVKTPCLKDGLGCLPPTGSGSANYSCAEEWAWACITVAIGKSPPGLIETSPASMNIGYWALSVLVWMPQSDSAVSSRRGRVDTSLGGLFPQAHGLWIALPASMRSWTGASEVLRGEGLEVSTQCLQKGYSDIQFRPGEWTFGICNDSTCLRVRARRYLDRR
jgi:hypothetical protein